MKDQEGNGKHEQSGKAFKAIKLLSFLLAFQLYL